MKIINKENFLSTVCVIYTILSLGKILIEGIIDQNYGNEQNNFVMIFVITIFAVLVLSQYYRLQKFPMFVVIIGQYLVLIAVVMGIVWIGGRFEPVSEGGYMDMFLSFTIPYVIGAIVYYVEVFAEIKQANTILKEISGSDF